ncbi:MAG TPA: NAD-dependent epimerase/dehydratase family protein [Actinomycetota bacterium]|nr:NAD-dependent epimerase/dehydratase family protein [Actinomycetota bacterium]
MRILVLGGDGYLGWPAAMYFSVRGHEVHAVDNYFRRRAHRSAGTDSLTPILDALPPRAEAWRQVTGYRVGVTEGDLCDWSLVQRVFLEFRPEAVLHLGQVASAPYSVVGRDHAVFTLYNNLTATLNVLWAIRDLAPEAHLVKVGSLSALGTPNVDVEEGLLPVRHEGREDRLPFPARPTSWYHAAEAHDEANVRLACETWGLRATVLRQGTVYGVDTEETRIDRRLLTRFDYDGVFGTVLNRFCVQAVIGHPLTVYGRGGQTRGFLNLVDALRGYELAVRSTPEAGALRTFNQFTELFSVNDLAELVRRAGEGYGLEVRVEHLENPRVEAEEHDYGAKHAGLLDAGLDPHYLSEPFLHSVFARVEEFRDRVVTQAILPRVRWRPAR